MGLACLFVTAAVIGGLCFLLILLLEINIHHYFKPEQLFSINTYSLYKFCRNVLSTFIVIFSRTIEKRNMFYSSENTDILEVVIEFLNWGQQFESYQKRTKYALNVLISNSYDFICL